jgi:two-component system, OmpR family, osmolarity sensor histidine kinase EnvZ
VRAAGRAVLDMHRRITRHVEQRTAMLAGVSHDLRTILTRFRLGLAMVGSGPGIKPLEDDVAEMQRMLEDYMNFVKGDGGEKSSPVDIRDSISSVVSALSREVSSHNATIDMAEVPTLTVELKPNAFRRLFSNLIGNALAYGSHIQISGEVLDERLWLYVDDNGPGIPEDKRTDAFRPFVRLDAARNMDDEGSGLGLAIALDIAHAHGGDIELGDSPLGGLRAAVRLPV